MNDKVKFLKSFRVRLILLLASFLLLTMAIFVALDNWSRTLAHREVEIQRQEVKDAVNDGYGDIAQAFGMAVQNLSSEAFLYRQIEDGKMKLPDTVEDIIVADQNGKVSDSTIPDLQDTIIPVPDTIVTQEGPVDPVESHVQLHSTETSTYNIPVYTQKGWSWIIIVTNGQAITNKINDASQALANKTRTLSNIRLMATTTLLILALATAVVIGWSFTRPIQELASAARKVAAGNLDFQVPVKRDDEVGQLAKIFNEMIAGLKSKRDLEDRLNQAERAAVIGRLTQSVAHEIRNPLNVINLSIDHASKKYAPEDPARREKFTQMLSSIKDEIERLKHLVSDLLNYGRPARLAVETIDMRQLVEDTLSLLRQQADVQGVSLTIDEGIGPTQVRGDRERLKSFVSNLAINALQAMPSGGHLAARIGRQNGVVEVKISDTGVGISEESLGKIFEPYFSTKQSGFGLGLAVTKKIIEDHQGTIAVESQLEHGTTFTVMLPAADEKAASDV